MRRVFENSFQKNHFQRIISHGKYLFRNQPDHHLRDLYSDNRQVFTPTDYPCLYSRGSDFVTIFFECDSVRTFSRNNGKIRHCVFVVFSRHRA